MAGAAWDKAVETGVGMGAYLTGPFRPLEEVLNVFRASQEVIERVEVGE